MMENYKKLLSELIGFKSISADAVFQNEILKAVAWYKSLFETNGLIVKVIEGYDNPLIVASYVTDPSLKTVLIYGHYDVQPASIEDGWSSEPFELAEKENRLWGRGVIDNKGQSLVHIVNVLDHIKNKTLTYNVKFLIEGNEETGSPHLQEFIQAYQDDLRADFALLSDGEMLSNLPAIEIGFRGIFNATLNVSVGTTDIHSGSYGGVAPNAVHELAKIISRFYKQDNTLFSQAMYKDAVVITPEMIADSKKVPFSPDEYQKATGRKVVFSQPGIDVHLRAGLMPSIEVTGIAGGYVGEGYRNAIAHKASAKLNVRLSPSQNPEKVFESFKKSLAEIVPKYVSFDLTYDQASKGTLLKTKSEYVAKAAVIMEKVWQTKPALKYVGGSLPIVTLFNELLSVPLVMAPLANDDCNMHGADENFDLLYLKKAMEFSQQFLGETSS